MWYCDGNHSGYYCASTISRRITSCPHVPHDWMLCGSRCVDCAGEGDAFVADRPLHERLVVKKIAPPRQPGWLRPAFRWLMLLEP